MTKTVNELWLKACEGVIPTISAEKWWKILEEHYQENHRRYHTLRHIYDLCNYWIEYSHRLKAPKDVFFAIIFHEYVFTNRSKRCSQ